MSARARTAVQQSGVENAAHLEFLNGTRCLFCHAPELLVTSENLVRCDRCRRTVATWHGDENRLAWRAAEFAQFADPDLADRVREEAKRWDRWAGERMPEFATPGKRLALDEPPTALEWLRASRTMRKALAACPALGHVVGWRVLDIGATCRHSVKFLRSGARRLDQVEISVRSQELGRLRLARSGLRWRDRVVFHTVMAEHLPFQDETFDLVFASGTLQYTMREQVFPEIRRVLRPGGVAFVDEFFLSDPLQRVMKARRRLANMDRVRNRPLRPADIAHAEQLFESVRWYPFDVLWLPWSQSLHRTRFGRRFSPAVRRLDLAVGSLGGLARVLGSRCWIVARK